MKSFKDMIESVLCIFAVGFDRGTERNHMTILILKLDLGTNS